MKIYFDGCAKTYGAAVQHNIKQRYSTLLCDKLGAEEYNIAIAGNSNRRIVKNLIENDLSKYDLFVIQMTKRYRSPKELISLCYLEHYNLKNLYKSRGFQNRHLLSEEEKQQWENYYNKIYKDKMGIIDEKISFHAIKSLLKNKKHVIIFMGNHECDVPVDFAYRKGKDYGDDFDENTHRKIYNDIMTHENIL
tara:strand:+ start:698 stop:1276 length:579 start_codon:yes stop_codon:yes gene_type:complete